MNIDSTTFMKATASKGGEIRITHSITFRQIRPDSQAVERNGERLGTLYQNPQHAERNAAMWRYWPARQSATPFFRTLEEAQETVREHALTP